MTTTMMTTTTITTTTTFVTCHCRKKCCCRPRRARAADCADLSACDGCDATASCCCACGRAAGCLARRCRLRPRGGRHAWPWLQSQPRRRHDHHRAAMRVPPRRLQWGRRRLPPRRTSRGSAPDAVAGATVAARGPPPPSPAAATAGAHSGLRRTPRALLRAPRHAMATRRSPRCRCPIRRSRAPHARRGACGRRARCHHLQPAATRPLRERLPHRDSRAAAKTRQERRADRCRPWPARCAGRRRAGCVRRRQHTRAAPRARPRARARAPRRRVWRPPPTSRPHGGSGSAVHRPPAALAAAKCRRLRRLPARRPTVDLRLWGATAPPHELATRGSVIHG